MTESAIRPGAMAGLEVVLAEDMGLLLTGRGSRPESRTHRLANKDRPLWLWRHSSGGIDALGLHRGHDCRAQIIVVLFQNLLELFICLIGSED
jgi:hypothetical protein